MAYYRYKYYIFIELQPSNRPNIYFVWFMAKKSKLHAQCLMFICACPLWIAQKNQYQPRKSEKNKRRILRDQFVVEDFIEIQFSHQKFQWQKKFFYLKKKAAWTRETNTQSQNGNRKTQIRAKELWIKLKMGTFWNKTLEN